MGGVLSSHLHVVASNPRETGRRATTDHEKTQDHSLAFQQGHPIRGERCARASLHRGRQQHPNGGDGQAAEGLGHVGEPCLPQLHHDRKGAGPRSDVASGGENGNDRAAVELPARTADHEASGRRVEELARGCWLGSIARGLKFSRSSVGDAHCSWLLPLCRMWFISCGAHDWERIVLRSWYFEGRCSTVRCT